jgi:hypothetical protein
VTVHLESVTVHPELIEAAATSRVAARTASEAVTCRAAPAAVTEAPLEAAVPGVSADRQHGPAARVAPQACVPAAVDSAPEAAEDGAGNEFKQVGEKE